MTKHQPGDVIVLNWEYRPEWYAVRGHVSQEEFVAAWDDYNHEPGWTAEFTKLETLNQQYARWELHGHDGWEGGRRVLVLHKEQKRGCFPVTVADHKPPPRF